jgi:hypothetical protein
VELNVAVALLLRQELLHLLGILGLLAAAAAAADQDNKAQKEHNRQADAHNRPKASNYESVKKRMK